MLNINIGKEIECEKYDFVIVGAGPAGLNAALYAARANFSVLVIEKEGKGDLLLAHKIDNYIGMPDSPSGKEMYEVMKSQVESFGAKIVEGTFLELDTMHKPHIVKTTEKNYAGDVVIIATGSLKNSGEKLKGEEEFIGKGVSYCATCDGGFYRNMEVAVFGNGEEAVEEALYLTQHASKVKFFVKEDKLKCGEDLEKTVLESDKIELFFSRELVEISGSDFVEKVLVKNGEEEEEHTTTAAFMYLGTKSNFELFSSIANVDEKGYVITEENMGTYFEGVYVAGDARKKAVKQVVTAAADGAIAALEGIKFIMQKRKENK